MGATSLAKVTGCDVSANTRIGGVVSRPVKTMPDPARTHRNLDLFMSVSSLDVAIEAGASFRVSGRGPGLRPGLGAVGHQQRDHRLRLQGLGGVERGATVGVGS